MHAPARSAPKREPPSADEVSPTRSPQKFAKTLSFRHAAACLFPFGRRFQVKRLCFRREDGRSSPSALRYLITFHLIVGSPNESRALGSETDDKRESGDALNQALLTLKSHAGSIDIATLLPSALWLADEITLHCLENKPLSRVYADFSIDNL
jgi:hypothetical protein